MIHVIASVRVKPGKLEEFVQLFKSFVPHVLAEKGCVEYFPAIDAPLFPAQALGADVVTILEKWESPEALQDHLGAPGFAVMMEKQKDLVEDTTIKVLRQA